MQRILGKRDGAIFLAVLNLSAPAIASEENDLAQYAELQGATVRLIDSATREQMEKLAQSGLITVEPGSMEQIWPDEELKEGDERRIRTIRARTLIEPAERKIRAARLLAGGGLLEEARPPAVETMVLATRALAALDGEVEPDDADAAYAFLVLRQIAADKLDSTRLAMEVLGGTELDDESLVAVGAFFDGITSMIEAAS